jgi:membrane protease YdiL (CAAX protease family)
MSSAALSGKRLALALGAWLLGAAAAAGVTFAAVRAIAPAADAGTLTPVIVAEVYVALIAALSLVLRRDRSEALALRSTTPAGVGLALLTVVVAYAVTAGLQSVVAPGSWTKTLEVLGAMGADDGRIATASAPMLGLIIFRACVLAAIGEELLFRGAVYTWLRGRTPAAASIVISAALFALIHGFPAVLPLTFAIGVGFGWIRERFSSTVPTVIAHALHNAAMLSVSYVLTHGAARLPQWGGG